MVKVESLKIGDRIYSDYTKAEYIITILPHPHPLKKDISYVALVRADGRGYCYLRRTLEDVQKEIYTSRERNYLMLKQGFEEIESR